MSKNLSDYNQQVENESILSKTKDLTIYFNEDAVKKKLKIQQQIKGKKIQFNNSLQIQDQHCHSLNLYNNQFQNKSQVKNDYYQPLQQQQNEKSKNLLIKSLDLKQFNYEFDDGFKIYYENNIKVKIEQPEYDIQNSKKVSQNLILHDKQQFQSQLIKNYKKKQNFTCQKMIDYSQEYIHTPKKVNTIIHDSDKITENKLINFNKQLRQQNHVIWKAIFNQFRKAFRMTVKQRMVEIPRLLIPKNGSLCNFELIMSFLELKFPQLMSIFISYVVKRFQDVFNRRFNSPSEQKFHIHHVELNKSNKQRVWIENEKETVEKYLDKLQKFLFESDYKQRIKILYIRKNPEAEKRIQHLRKQYARDESILVKIQQ